MNEDKTLYDEVVEMLEILEANKLKQKDKENKKNGSPRNND